MVASIGGIQVEPAAASDTTIPLFKSIQYHSVLVATTYE